MVADAHHSPLPKETSITPPLNRSRLSESVSSNSPLDFGSLRQRNECPEHRCRVNNPACTSDLHGSRQCFPLTTRLQTATVLTSATPINKSFESMDLHELVKAFCCSSCRRASKKRPLLAVRSQRSSCGPLFPPSIFCFTYYLAAELSSIFEEALDLLSSNCHHYDIVILPGHA